MLDFDDLRIIEKKILQLIPPYDSDIDAVQLDALTYVTEKKILFGENSFHEIRSIKNRVGALMNIMNIPDVAAKRDLIYYVVSDRFDSNAGISMIEKIRIELRDLMKYIDRQTKVKLNTNFTDEILSVDIHDSDLKKGKFVDYPEKFRKYVEEHPEVICFEKMRHNIPLGEEDISDLSRICWSEIGTEEEYEEFYGNKSILTVLREITGIDRDSALKTFERYIDFDKLSNRQCYFLERVLDYIVSNGFILDKTIFQKSPFIDKGDIVDLFGDEMGTWNAINNAIDEININAGVEI